MSPKQKIKTTAMIVFAFVFLATAGLEAKSFDTLKKQVKKHTLSNGMTFIVLERHDAPVASYHLYVAAGSANESYGITGISHLLEHMAFNGTEHFPDKGIINFLERHGVAFGENINAYTSQNQTVYNLSDVPVNKPKIPLKTVHN